MITEVPVYMMRFGDLASSHQEFSHHNGLMHSIVIFKAGTKLRMFCGFEGFKL